MPQSRTLVVHGTVALPAATGPLRASRVAVFVEDVSRADAPAVVLASREYEPATFAADGTFRFSLDVPVGAVEAQHRYGVRVHVDVDGARVISRGHYVSTQHHGVLTNGGGLEVRVPVTRV